MKIFAPLFAASLLAVSAPVAFAQPAPGQADDDQQYSKMQEQMKLMRAQMDKIGQTQDPQERQRLMEEYMSSMQAMMSLMRSAPGGMGMMGCRQADRWIPMQQMMIDQMMRHQHWMMQPPPPPAPPAKK